MFRHAALAVLEARASETKRQASFGAETSHFFQSLIPHVNGEHPRLAIQVIILGHEVDDTILMQAQSRIPHVEPAQGRRLRRLHGFVTTATRTRLRNWKQVGEAVVHRDLGSSEAAVQAPLLLGTRPCPYGGLPVQRVVGAAGEWSQARRERRSRRT